MKPSINFLHKVRWSSARILALIIIALGVYGVFSFLISDLPRSNLFGTGHITNPVYWNDQRLTSDNALDQLTRQFRTNFATVIGFSAFILLVSVHYASVARGLYAYAPVRSIIAAIFLGGSVLFGLLVGLALMRVNEFAFQVASAGAEQKEWLRTGVVFLIQIHLIFVYGWILCTGLGWMSVGSGAIRGNRWMRRMGAIELLAGLMLVIAVIARAWLPNYGEMAPRFSVFLSNLFEPGIGLGLVASGVLFWLFSFKGDELS